MSCNRQYERGGALVMALMLVVVVGMWTTSMTGGARSMDSATVAERTRLQLLQAADGGLEQTRLRLRDDPSFAGEVVTIGGVEVTIEVARGPGTWAATATARSRAVGASRLPSQRRLVAEFHATGGMPARKSWAER